MAQFKKDFKRLYQSLVLDVNCSNDGMVKRFKNLVEALNAQLNQYLNS